MIRFVKIDGQILDGVVQFAFYDTVVDKFITIADDQVWDSIADLRKAVEFEHKDRWDSLGHERLAALEERLVSFARSAGIAEESEAE